jgi:hypothetical protein
MTHYAVLVMVLALVAGLTLYVWRRPPLPFLGWLLVPIAITLLVGIWTAVVSPYTKYGDSWAVIPVLGALVVVLLWHVWLVVRGPGREVLIAYGVAHLAFWVPFGFLCLMKISKDSL